MQKASPQVNHSPRRRGSIDFFMINPDKILVLSVLTGGLYLWYWMYQNWKGVTQSGYSTMPILFGVLFHPISSFGLFRLMRKASYRAGYPKEPGLWLDGAIWLSLHIVGVTLALNAPIFLTSIVGYQGVALSYIGLVMIGSWLIQDIQKGIQHYGNMAFPEKSNNDDIESIHLGMGAAFMSIYITVFFLYPKDIPFYPDFSMPEISFPTDIWTSTIQPFLI